MKCRWCGYEEHGGICPTIKAIEFFDDGVTVKRVEFKTASDYVTSSWPIPMPATTTPLVPVPFCSGNS